MILKNKFAAILLTNPRNCVILLFKDNSTKRETPMKKRNQCLLLFIIIAVLIILGGCSRQKTAVTVNADDKILSSGEKGGFLYNKYNNYIGISKYIGESSNKLIIPEMIDSLPVAKLEDEFLNENFTFSKIVLPDTIVWIGSHSLISESEFEVNIPKSVRYVGLGALEGAKFEDKEFLIIGDGVLVGYNGNNEKITLPSNVKVIGMAFYSSKSISEIYVNSGCEEIESSAFAFSSAKYIYLPDSINKIGRDCFIDSSLESIRMPSGDCEIGKNAFQSTNKNLVLTVCEGSDPMLYSVENELRFRFENRDEIFDSSFLQVVGIGKHTFTLKNEQLDLNIEEANISPDKAHAIVLESTDDNDIDCVIYYLDLRTLRITDRISFDKTKLIGLLESGSIENYDYSSCKFSGSLTPFGWGKSTFSVIGEYVISRGDDEWSVMLSIEYLPNSGYLSADNIKVDTSLPEYLGGYTMLTATDDLSAKLYAKKDSDSSYSSPMIRWTFGNIKLDSDKLAPNCSPSLILSDLNGDGIDDLLLLSYPDGRSNTSAVQCAEIFLGPTGAKKFKISPLSDFESSDKYTELFSNNEMSVTVGKYTYCEASGNHLIATLSVQSDDPQLDTKATNTAVIMVYSYTNGKIQLENIFSAREPFHISDDHASIWKIGESELLFVCGETSSTEKNIMQSDNMRLLEEDLDADGEPDIILVLEANEMTETNIETHREELYILTSSDKKLRKLDALSDAISSISIESTDNGWHFSNKFGKFDLTLDEFPSDDKADSEESESNSFYEMPDLTQSFEYSFSNGRVICNMKIALGDGIMSEALLRLTYKFDSQFRLCDILTIPEGTAELTMDYDSMKSYLSAIYTESVPNVLIKLTDLDEPTLLFSHNGYAFELVLMNAKGQNVTFDNPLITCGSHISFDLFEVDGYLIVRSLGYDFGDTYIFADDGIYRNYSTYDQSTEDYLTFFEDDDDLKYERIAMRYNTADLTITNGRIIFERITSLDDFYKEIGNAEIVDGELTLVTERSLTISETFELDELLKQANISKTLPELIEQNIQRLTAESGSTDISITYADLISEFDSFVSIVLNATIIDAENAVLTIEDLPNGKFLTRLEARGQTLVFDEPKPFGDPSVLEIFTNQNVSVFQICLDEKCQRYIFTDSMMIEESDCEKITNDEFENDFDRAYEYYFNKDEELPESGELFRLM